ncbi:hypothetical protein Tco_1514183, partial [Tanacetum coccineum]
MRVDSLIQVRSSSISLNEHVADDRNITHAFIQSTKYQELVSSGDTTTPQSWRESDTGAGLVGSRVVLTSSR